MIEDCRQKICRNAVGLLTFFIRRKGLKVLRSGKKLAFFLAVLELGFFSFLGGGSLFAQDADTQEPAAKLEVSQESYIQEDAPKAVSIPIPKRVTSSLGYSNRLNRSRFTPEPGINSYSPL